MCDCRNIKSPWLTIGEAAMYLKYSERHVRRLIARGNIKYSKLPNGGVRIHKYDLDSYILFGLPFKKLTTPQKESIYDTRD